MGLVPVQLSDPLSSEACSREREVERKRENERERAVESVRECMSNRERDRYRHKEGDRHRELERKTESVGPYLLSTGMCDRPDRKQIDGSCGLGWG